jgi:Subtilase family
MLERCGVGLCLVALTFATGSATAATPRRTRPAPPVAPTLLPGEFAAAAVPNDQHTWLVGAVDGKATRSLAKRFGAVRLLRRTAVFEVRRDRARAFAAALKARKLYSFSEPNRLVRKSAFPADPLSGGQWGPAALGLPPLTPPAPGLRESTIGIIEDGIDLTRPEWAAGSVRVLGTPYPDAHGTEVASVAAAAFNGVGIVGVWPGAHIVVSDPRDGTCGSVARAIDRAVNDSATVLNMSYGFYGRGRCYAHYLATTYAFAEGVILVAAAGNDFAGRKSASIQPAGDPHTLTVGALAPGDKRPAFSNANDALDLAAPGVNVLAATPPAFDDDGTVDGYKLVHGTSFSAPAVAAGVAWVQAVRPGLSTTQLDDLLRYSARDVGPRGWDPYFGFGAFDVGRALRARAPFRDPLEPNDDIDWVDGRHLTGDLVWGGHGRRTVLGTLDQYEDPIDVYRVEIPGRVRFRITLQPVVGDPDVRFYAGEARTVYRNRGLVVGSRRRGRRVDEVVVSKHRRGAEEAYVVVYPKARGPLVAGYRLTLKRLR